MTLPLYLKVPASLALCYFLTACASQNLNRHDVANVPAASTGEINDVVLTPIREAFNTTPAPYRDYNQENAMAAANRAAQEAEALYDQRYARDIAPRQTHNGTPARTPGLRSQPVGTPTVQTAQEYYNCTTNITDRFYDYHQVRQDAIASSESAINTVFDGFMQKISQARFFTRLESNITAANLDDHPASACVKQVITALLAAQSNGVIGNADTQAKLAAIHIVMDGIATMRAESIAADETRGQNMWNGYMIELHDGLHRTLPTSLQTKRVINMLVQDPVDASRPALPIATLHKDMTGQRLTFPA